jgi:hypothetical protein
MAKRSVTPQKSKIYPLISAKERLAVWEKARGAWKRRRPDPIAELGKLRREWLRKGPSSD